MGQLMESPEYKRLKQEVHDLRAKLESLLYYRDELKYVICENIKSDYMLAIGGLEYKLYEAYCEYCRLRRKREMIQAKINRNEVLSMDLLEDRLDLEFRDYQKKLQERVSDLQAALERSKLRVMSEEESKEFKGLYRSLVKLLHPDLHPNRSERDREFFVQATQAYKNGDLPTLQVIFQMVKQEEETSEEVVPAMTLEGEKEKLVGYIQKMEKEIEEIQSKPPYSWKIYLDDPEKKAQKIAELMRELKGFREGIRTQQEAIQELLGRMK